MWPGSRKKAVAERPSRVVRVFYDELAKEYVDKISRAHRPPGWPLLACSGMAADKMRIVFTAN